LIARFAETGMVATADVSRVPLLVIGAYLGLLLLLGALSARFFRGTSADYFVASRSIGPFLLLMSVFGTTMTSFALVGSTGKSFDQGIGVYGLMASWSGLVHSAVFFFVGIKLWAIGKRFGYMTQVQYFRDRFQSDLLGYVLFVILVALVIPYLLMGLLGAGATVRGISGGMFPEVFPATDGALPQWLTGLVICAVVLGYVFFGGVRGAAWANTFQTLVFMATGVVAFYMISQAMGGLGEATARVAEHSPQHLQREGMFGKAEFFTYMFIPLSVGMFPHVFQHWLTARSAKTFRLTVVAHPLCITIVWVPTVLIGVWAAGLVASGDMAAVPSNRVLGAMVGELVNSPLLMGLLTAGILAAIMSSLDSQFVCMGTMFTRDIVIHLVGEDRFTDRQKLWISRSFIVAIVAMTYGLSLQPPPHIFDLGIWCFSGFSGLFSLVVASLYWKRVTRPAALACVAVTALVWGALIADALIFTGNRYFGPDEGDYLIMGMMPVTIIVAVSTLTLVIVSLLTPPMDAQRVSRFFAATPAGNSRG